MAWPWQEPKTLEDPKSVTEIVVPKIAKAVWKAAGGSSGSGRGGGRSRRG